MILFALLQFAMALPDRCQVANYHKVKTQDASFICIQHHPNTGPPVLLVHGISSNHRFFDLEKDLSLCQYLQHHGYDVWNMDFRGHGFATHHATGRLHSKTWNIDDYGRYDIKAAIDYIEQKNASKKVTLIGHSLGGMAAAIYLTHHGQDNLDSLVVMASPMDFSDPDPIWNLVSRGAKLSVWGIPSPLLGRIASWNYRLTKRIEKLIWNPQNISQQVRKKLLRNIVSPLTKNELKQLAVYLKSGHFASQNQQLNYRHKLQQVDIPALFIAGRQDYVAPADRVWAYYQALGSTNKQFMLAGQAEGFRHNYGHLGYTLGKHAPEEIYPAILQWLEKQN